MAKALPNPVGGEATPPTPGRRQADAPTNYDGAPAWSRRMGQHLHYVRKLVRMGRAQDSPQPLQNSYGRMALWACLLLAVIMRVWLVIHTHGVIDGDEALVGIQAEHILRGELPLYFYGQPYLGSLEAYLIAVLFAIVGPASWALRTEPILLSLVLVWLTWKLAGALADAAHLPEYAKRSFMTIAALLAAVPPLYDSVAELRTWGGLIETFILMLLLLLSALQLMRRWHTGASQRELALRWAGIGFIVGLGFWIYPLMVSAVLAAALWIIYGWIRSVTGAGRGDAPSPIKMFLPALVAIPASLVGFAPALLWGATHQWQNITYLLGLGSGTDTHRLSTIRKVTQLYATCVAPRVIDGAVPHESLALATVHSPLLVLGIFCILTTATLVALSFLSPQPLLLRIRRLAAFPLIFGACTALIFSISTVSASGLVSSCDADFAGRYATPLLLALPFFFATLFTIATMYMRERALQRSGVAPTWSQGPVPQGAGKLTPLLTTVMRPQLGRVVWAIARVASLRRIREGMSMVVGLIPAKLASAVLFVFLLLYLGTQIWTYGVSDAAALFQSPFCLEAPANNDSIIAYMQHEHIRYAWAANLLAYPIAFKTNEDIIIANPLAITNPRMAINRIPAYTTAVQHADRPSILVFIRHEDAHPLLLMMLDEEQVTYRAARFPSEPGVDVLVVTPLSRTVLPFESSSFNGFFICNR